MLMGAACRDVCARRSSQVASDQSYDVSYTTLAVAGGCSVCIASGSAFCRQTESAPRISYLYRVPTGTSGMKISQTPDDPSERIGWPRPFQKLKSPVTRTPRAFGAQTAKDTPVVPS